jgi:hypothetical protein
MWQHVGTCLALYLGLKRVRGVPSLQGTDIHNLFRHAYELILVSLKLIMKHSLFI